LIDASANDPIVAVPEPADRMLESS